MAIPDEKLNVTWYKTEVDRLEHEIDRLRAELEQYKANSMIQEYIIERGRNPADTDKIIKLAMENSSLKAEMARERERAKREPDDWERIINAYGELEGFVHTKCGHQSQSATHYCSNCGHNMAIAEAEAALKEAEQK